MKAGTRWSEPLGFSALPPLYWPLLTLTLLCYVLLTQSVKTWLIRKDQPSKRAGRPQEMRGESDRGCEAWKAGHRHRVPEGEQEDPAEIEIEAPVHREGQRPDAVTIILPDSLERGDFNCDFEPCRQRRGLAWLRCPVNVLHVRTAVAPFLFRLVHRARRALRRRG